MFDEYDIDVVVELSRSEIVSGLGVALRKSGKGFNVAKTVILVVALLLFLIPMIYEGNFMSFSSIVCVVIIAIIFMLWFLPAYQYGKNADEMIKANKNSLHVRIKEDLFIFGNENTESIDFRENPPIICDNIMVFKNNGNIFVVPKRVLGTELWDKFTS